MSKVKALAVALTAVAFIAAAIPSEARVGASTSSSSTSRSVSTSSTSSTSRSFTSSVKDQSTSGRVGAVSSSIGMSRPTTMTTAQSNSIARANANTAPQSAPVRTYPQSNQPAYAPNSGTVVYNNGNSNNNGYTTGHMAAAAAVGAVAGYALGHNNNPQVVVENQGGYAPAPVYQNNGGYAPTAPSAPVYTTMAATPVVVHESSGAGVWFLLIVLFAVIGFVVYKLLNNESQVSESVHSYASHQESVHAATPLHNTNRPVNTTNALEADLLDRASNIYTEIQQANNKGDLETLRKLTTDEVYPTLEEGVNTRESASETRVHSIGIMNDEVLDFIQRGSRYVGSIHFVVEISENGGPVEEIEELWHFARDVEGGHWKVAGIQAV